MIIETEFTDKSERLYEVQPCICKVFHTTEDGVHLDSLASNSPHAVFTLSTSTNDPKYNRREFYCSLVPKPLLAFQCFMRKVGGPGMQWH